MSGSKHRRRKARGKRTRSRWRALDRFAGWSWKRKALAVVGALCFLQLLFLGTLYAFARVPEPSDLALAQSVLVVDRDGEELGRIASEADRMSIPLREMPSSLRNAVIATEDRRFYHHKGIKLTSIARAAVVNLVGRSVRQGGSTITQQYVKNAFTGNDRTIFRKTREAILALKLERRRSKDEILERYCNTIYFGRGAYGVEAAARTYFGKKAKQLTLPESALLAGLIQAPEAYDPVNEPDTARARRDVVLGFMVRDRHITEAEARAAEATPVRVRTRRMTGIATHYLEEVRRDLEKHIGERQLYAGGITVTATLDLEMQQAAEKAVRSVYDRKRDPEAALVAIDPATGAVRAMVGSRDFARRQFNIAMRGRRQPGSSFKPAVLAAAVEDGIEVGRSYPAPATATFDTDTGPWKVSNYDGRSYGTLPLTRATELSVNTVYARLALDVGLKNVVEAAHRLGIVSELKTYPSLALGTLEVTPLELASMYATLAARGSYREPYLVQNVVGRGGRIFFQAPVETEEVVERYVADTVNEVLQGVIEQGTGRSADIGRPAAGKTGTTEGFRDAWFAGYTPDLATVVWNGYPGKRKTLRGVRGIDVTGGSFPARIWRAFMLDALEGVPRTPFEKPDPPEPEPSATTVTESARPSSTELPVVPSGELSEPAASSSAAPKPAPTATKKSGGKGTPTPTATASPTPTASETSGA